MSQARSDFRCSFRHSSARSPKISSSTRRCCCSRSAATARARSAESSPLIARSSGSGALGAGLGFAIPFSRGLSCRAISSGASKCRNLSLISSYPAASVGFVFSSLSGMST
ncbi:hypothetical protein XH94_32575 [Bradyrhizobium zhanjiangense]|uniref:Uncharacterized protein n=1 Tax=Bradyrhizobium zhanjiangense TaxID=1325107 RepID=A0A4Q0SC15_9BRAD|nr:hypothetical protein XH94_32575 [Bradyrhizobium zhanjiangense]